MLLVLANVKSSNSTEGSSDQEAMAFLVNKNQAGVTVTEEPETIGFNGIRKTTIQFSNVTVNNGKLFFWTWNLPLARKLRFKFNQLNFHR